MNKNGSIWPQLSHLVPQVEIDFAESLLDSADDRWAITAGGWGEPEMPLVELNAKDGSSINEDITAPRSRVDGYDHGGVADPRVSGSNDGHDAEVEAERWVAEI